MDLIPSINPDAELNAAASSDEDAVMIKPVLKGKKQQRKPAAVSWDGLDSDAEREQAEQQRVQQQQQIKNSKNSNKKASVVIKEQQQAENQEVETEAVTAAPARPAIASWSFQNAIAHIDATQRQSSVTTSLRQKIATVQRNNERQAQRAAAAAEEALERANNPGSKAGNNNKNKKKRKHESESDDEILEEVEEEEEDEDDDEEDEDEDDDDDDDDDEVEEEEDVPPTKASSSSSSYSKKAAVVVTAPQGITTTTTSASSSSSNAKSTLTSTTTSHNNNAHISSTADDMIAQAKPNPYRQKAAASGTMGNALDPELAKAYDAFFELDPFSEQGQAALKKKQKEQEKQQQKTNKKQAKNNSSNTNDDSDDEENEDTGDKVRIVTKDASSTANSSTSSHAKKGKKNALPTPPPTTATQTSAAALKEPKTFPEMNLSRPLLKALQELGYTSPTPIQRRAVPLALAGHDICGSAVTGSGKTAAYLLPILERLLFKPARAPAALRVLVLVPTRELATQVHSMCCTLAKHCPNIRATLIVGGLSLKPQEAELRGRPDIVIATPGRLLDHIRNTMTVHCDDVDVLVLDEADRLLEMGFEGEVTEIVKHCPPGRQTMLFSATMTARVETLVKLSLRKPVRVTADPLYDMASRLVQEFVRVRAGKEEDREALLLALICRSFPGPGVLIFTSHKRDAHRLAIVLGLAGLSASELHGNLTQRQRLEALEDFRTETVDYMVATDLAGRGLDIPGVRVVINLEMPRDMTTYVHRVGRTARAGRSGVAVTLVGESQRSLMKEVVKRAALNVRARTVPPDIVAAYRGRLREWEPDVGKVLQAERMERELRLAEMETAKASNLMEHDDEIHARPARTWFMTENQKKDLKEASNAAVGAGGGGRGRNEKNDFAEEDDDEADANSKSKKLAAKHNEGHRLSRKKRRRMEDAKETENEARRVSKLEAQAKTAGGAANSSGGDNSGKRGRGGGAKAEDGDGDIDRDVPGGFGAASMDELRKAKKNLEATRNASVGQYRLAKKAKSVARQASQKLGMSSGKVAFLLNKKNEKQKGGKRDKNKTSGGDGGGGGGGFGEEKTSIGGAKKHTGGAGHHSFKSMSRHKRR